VNTARIHSHILTWYDQNKRDLPWRKSADPFRIWISEIMLQQTRVETVQPYYQRFLTRFPDLLSLATAETDELLNLWAGLGYYSRARNLQAAAQQILANFGGRFPESLEDLRSLKGIGPYTAAAIASMAFGRAHAAIDGNLERVFSRLLGSRQDPKKEGRIRIEKLGQDLVELGRPGDINQAFMDLASMICLPKIPKCESCPLQANCKAYAMNLQALIPTKKAKLAPIELQAKGVIVLAKEELLLARRPKGEWLAGMWDIPWWIEGKTKASGPKASSCFFQYSQVRTITKHKIYFAVSGFQFDRKPHINALGALPGTDFRWVPLSEMHAINLPRPTEKALEATLRRLELDSEKEGVR